MKKIGFIDYYLSEWHANNYPQWIKKASEKMGKDFTVAYAYAELDVSPLDNVSSAEWCEKNGVTLCKSIAELCEMSDCILILAPTNPETHKRLAEAALPSGKITYIDKTFAPDLKTAEEIYAIAQRYGTRFFSSSALRYCDELIPYAKSARTADVVGGGSNFDEYIIHQAEMIVKLLGVGAVSAVAEKVGDKIKVEISYPDERRASMLWGDGLPFSVDIETLEGEKRSITPTSNYFDNLISDILRFYDTGVLSFEKEETLEVMKIRELAIISKNSLA